MYPGLMISDGPGACAGAIVSHGGGSCCVIELYRPLPSVSGASGIPERSRKPLLRLS